jgi:hypothetical protein
VEAAFFGQCLIDSLKMPLSRVLASALIVFAVPFQAPAIDKDGLLSKYKDKVVVVMNDGISTGICDTPGSSSQLGALLDRSSILNPPSLSVMIKGLGLGDVRVLNVMHNCAVEPARKGEVLKVLHAAFRSGYFILDVENVSAHSLTRGIGAFAHQSLETRRATIEFRAGNNGKDTDAAGTLAAHWFEPFNTAADAAKLGNTAAGVFVNQVKAGMSFAEVEAALGVPQTRVDLGEKVLYKYKDMTVEFQNGKVTDVR